MASANALAFDYCPFPTVTDIQCSFASQGSNLGDIITAKLKKPIGFKGAPLFADDRAVNPEADFACSIKQDRKDVSELAYDLKITDFSRCGVLKRNVSNSTACFRKEATEHRAWRMATRGVTGWSVRGSPSPVFASLTSSVAVGKEANLVCM